MEHGVAVALELRLAPQGQRERRDPHQAQPFAPAPPREPDRGASQRQQGRRRQRPVGEQGGVFEVRGQTQRGEGEEPEEGGGELRRELVHGAGL